jgi:cytochrome P450
MSLAAAPPPRFPFRRVDPLQPPPQYGEARATQPIVPVKLWNGRRAWLLTRYDDVRSVVTDARFSGEFANPDFPTVTEARVVVDKEERAFVGMDNPRHDHYRRMFTKEFSTRRMMALRPKMAAIANRLIDLLTAQPQPADLVATIAVPFPSLVMCDLVGSPYEDHPFIIECAAGRHGLLQTPAQAAQKARELADYFLRLIRRKERAPGDDLVSRVIEEHVRPGNLSREDFAEIGAMILRAGHDTTTNMIGLGTLILLNHPEQAAAVRDEPDLVPSAVEELLRYISPVQFSPRRVAMEDVAIGDVVIRRGDGVFALNPAANRDPDVFPDPDTFDVRRDASHHVAFGWGIHQCLGQILARMELQTVFPLLLQRLPNLRVAANEGEIRFKDDMQIYGVHNLPVAW